MFGAVETLILCGNCTADHLRTGIVVPQWSAAGEGRLPKVTSRHPGPAPLDGRDVSRGRRGEATVLVDSAKLIKAKAST